MTCYRVNWKLTKEELDPIMYWLDENKEALGLIRGRADQGADRNGDGRVWYTKFVFKTEEGIRMFYRRWAPRYSEDSTIEPHGK